MQKSYTEMTQEELEKLEMDSSLEEVAPAEAPSPEQNAPPWLKVLAIGVTVAVLGYGVAQTKFGAWLANEWAVTSTLIQKVSAVATRILESIPWPSPEHGAESIWETLTILFASVLVRRRAPPATARCVQKLCSAPALKSTCASHAGGADGAQVRAGRQRHPGLSHRGRRHRPLWHGPHHGHRARQAPRRDWRHLPPLQPRPRALPRAPNRACAAGLRSRHAAVHALHVRNRQRRHPARGLLRPRRHHRGRRARAVLHGGGDENHAGALRDGVAARPRHVCHPPLPGPRRGGAPHARAPPRPGRLRCASSHLPLPRCTGYAVWAASSVQIARL